MLSLYRGESRTAEGTVFIELPGALPEIRGSDPLPLGGGDCTDRISDCPGGIGTRE